ncbi:hypothetical protein V6N12_069437 [Hibiscus sabdariffa]|uniref:Uncharacterized protein n=1 Tax=Hibiscus sabdariffa TaxID=183260 RepID=A0ABR2FE05_9ROSI
MHLVFYPIFIVLFFLQNEDSTIWMAAAGHDISNLPVNPLYNVSFHGQQFHFSPAQAGHGAIAGLYLSSQTIAPPSNVNTLLQHSQAMAAATAETAVPASSAYQHLNSHNSIGTLITEPLKYYNDPTEIRGGTQQQVKL